MEDKTRIPQEILQAAEEASLNLLPAKSKVAYNKEFGDFNQWIEKKGVSVITEDVLLAYFFTASKRLAASSLWTKYSMLKTTLKVHRNIDIANYGKLISFLKSKFRIHRPKKAKILEQEHIKQFLQEAPEDKYLMMKVGLIMGIAGACRCNELTYLKVGDVKDKGAYLLITIPDTKTYVSRCFAVMEDGFCVNAVDICRRYMLLRPVNVTTDRFFLRYLDGKCTVQCVGINTMSKVPTSVASFLKLPDAESYTGHSMRRSSATMLANAGSDLTTIKRHGGWKSSTVAEGYIAESLSNKLETAKKIQGEASTTINAYNIQGPSVADPLEIDNLNTLKNLSRTIIDTNDKKTLSIDININVNVNK